MSEYVCDECRSAKENDEIYCLCRQPYDESQFYIGCERCSDWFHGRCVGILQAEAKDIDEYVCPKCDPHSKQNYPNLKKLNRADHELIRKTFKAIKQNRHSQQFMEPVDQRENPKYYEIVKSDQAKQAQPAVYGARGPEGEPQVLRDRQGANGPLNHRGPGEQKRVQLSGRVPGRHDQDLGELQILQPP